MEEIELFDNSTRIVRCSISRKVLLPQGEKYILKLKSTTAPLQGQGSKLPLSIPLTHFLLIKLSDTGLGNLFRKNKLIRDLVFGK